jgi:hypothetical protein
MYFLEDPFLAVIYNIKNEEMCTMGKYYPFRMERG